MTILRASHHRHPLALAVALALAANLAHAATVTVTSSGDTALSDSNTCTLRQAIVTVTDGGTPTINEGNCRTHATISPYDFGSHDTIVFANQMINTTINLNLGALWINSLTTDLTIQGSNQAIDANENSRVLRVDSSTLTVSNLTLTGGAFSIGGGVYVGDGTLTLTHSTVSGNSATNGGGGIAAEASSVTLIDSTVSGNSATYSDGGGIYAAGSSVTLTDCSVVDNHGYTEGGGVKATFSTMTLTNSTVWGNEAIYGGGVDAHTYSTVTFTNTTVSGNFADGGGGGAFAGNYTTLNLYNTILANNVGGDCGRSGGSVSAQNSLIKDSSQSCGIGNNTNGNILGHDPMLGPLQDNGGPTLTMALLPGSPAIDTGSNTLASGLNYDQRGPGFSRIINGKVDIGAYEQFEQVFRNGFESGP